jgi:hypothetical protein
MTNLYYFLGGVGIASIIWFFILLNNSSEIRKDLNDEIDKLKRKLPKTNFS